MVSTLSLSCVYRTKMKTVMVMVLMLLLLSVVVVSRSHGKCDFEAIFNFGDSNSDTGGFFSAFPSQPLPNGMTYFKKPTGRPSDGRLYIDFLASALGLPFLSPYLQSIGSDFRHGANFATSASTVLLPNTSLFVTGVSPFSLAIQLKQLKEFKSKVDDNTNNSASASGGRPTRRIVNLPAPDIFGKSLYTFYIGQNDFTGNLAYIGIEGVKKYLPQVISQIASTIKELYALGGRTFLVLNLAPIGCYPAFLVELPHASSDIDDSGCMISYNNAVIEYNTMLKEAMRRTRQELPADANLIYADSHAVLLDLFQHPKSHGLQYGTKACCGYGAGAYNFNQHVFCGYSNWIDGKQITANACDDPQNYVSWDGIHTTEAANKLLVQALLHNTNASYFDPPFSFHKYCDIQPI